MLICTTNPRVFLEIQSLCGSRGIACCLLDAAILKIKRDQYHEAAALLDPVSREIYHRLLAIRATPCGADASLYAGESYFGIPEFCRSSATDVILDCGAYVGDSAERFIWRMEQFKKYIALEPDADNFQAMQKRFRRLNEEWNFPEGKLVAMHCGVDETTRLSNVRSGVGGLGSVIDNSPSDGAVQLWAIDDLAFPGIDAAVQSHLGADRAMRASPGAEPLRIDFIKADIESYEYRMLCGARRTVRECAPRLAVCIYHNIVDMYSIPLLVHQMNPAYRLAVRHHSYGYEETVLYAY